MSKQDDLARKGPDPAPTAQTPEVLGGQEWKLPRAVVFTQCVQNDFMRRLKDGEPLPTLVHVGRLEAERLLGESGSLPRFMEELHGLDPDDVMIVHIVDKHTREEHAAHLKRFKPHALEGTEGAELIDPIGKLASKRPNTFIVPAGDMNDFEASDLYRLLREKLEGRNLSGVKVAVLGVWTDAKVRFNCYDLVTRLGAKDIATCSALDASRSLEGHHRALQELETYLGVRIFHSPRSLLEWVSPVELRATAIQKPIQTLALNTLHNPSKWNEHTLRERDSLLSQLVSSEGPVSIRQLGGGFSGAQVLLVEDASGIGVIKIGERNDIGRERYGNERVSRTLRNKAPQLLGVREGNNLAAMRFALAGSSSGSLETYQALAQNDQSESRTEILLKALELALGHQGMGPFYRTGEKDNADLFEIYGFSDGFGNVPFGQSVIDKSIRLAMECGFKSVEELFDDSELKSQYMKPNQFYGSWLIGRTMVREIYSALVHGDLNLQNILVDGWRDSDRVLSSWLIDFARLARLPVLTDYAKIENDLTYIVFPIADNDALIRARGLQEARLAAPTLVLPTSFAAMATTPAEKRYVALLTRVRQLAHEMDDRGAKAVEDYRLALMRYSAHTIGFDEPNLMQRRLALEGTAILARQISRQPTEKI